MRSKAEENEVVEAESPTTDDQKACLRERALVSVVANAAIGPFWLIPFTVLVTLLTRGESDMFRSQWWMGSAAASTILISVGVLAYCRATGRSRSTPTGGLTPGWV